jgi:cyclophilin family peptidyl-prolyl cis-trans isomerase
MRTVLSTLVLMTTIAAFSAAQSASTSKSATPPAHKAATSAAPAAEPTAIIHTSAGDLHCALYPKVAPLGVQNFIGLASGTKDWTSPVSHAKKHGVPLYDGTIFHRVIANFMIQGGDPAGNGSGDPGYKFKNETSPSVAFDRPGRLAYANAGPDTNGSQFFVTEVPYPSLNGNYTIFGQCDDDAIELVKKIARMPTDGERPLRPIKITHVEIHRAGASAAKPATRPTAKPTSKPAASPKKPT